jgi:hypothetical protein
MGSAPWGLCLTFFLPALDAPYSAELLRRNSTAFTSAVECIAEVTVTLFYIQ